jgi:Xaa-Pro aminopeptidase
MGAAGAQTVDTSKRLAGLRELMGRKDNSVQAFVVPSEDQRKFAPIILRCYLLTSTALDSSEYLAHCDERRAFISGFNGSAGDTEIASITRTMF